VELSNRFKQESRTTRLPLARGYLPHTDFNQNAISKHRAANKETTGEKKEAGTHFPRIATVSVRVLKFVQRAGGFAAPSFAPTIQLTPKRLGSA
jgi:hypothetical protein